MKGKGANDDMFPLRLMLLFFTASEGPSKPSRTTAGRSRQECDPPRPISKPCCEDPASAPSVPEASEAVSVTA